MPLHAIGWTTEEDENLAKLVEPHAHLYNILDPSRKDILARESTWKEIAQTLSKPVEECKKRWRGLRDGYMRSKRSGTLHWKKVSVFEKLQFLDESAIDCGEDYVIVQPENMEDINEQTHDDPISGVEEQVITDNQEYYEITVVDGPQESLQDKPYIKLMPKLEMPQEPPKKIGRKNAGRRKAVPVPRNVPPVKILPKPIVLNGPKLVRYVDTPKVTEQKSSAIDKLIEKVLKENTNEIDVFFRSMAASVKKLQPNLIPKVKMEVCNVIAKYEMQSYERGNT